MSNDDLKRKPHPGNKNGDWWWYEETQGIAIVVESTPITSRVVHIPWRSIRAALERKDKE